MQEAEHWKALRAALITLKNPQTRQNGWEVLNGFSTRQLVEAYCYDEGMRDSLLPYLIDRLHTQPLIIQGQELTLYNGAKEPLVWKPKQGVEALKKVLQDYNAGKLNLHGNGGSQACKVGCSVQ